MTVSFDDAFEADACVAALNGRLLVGRAVNAAQWDGRERFKREETDAEREARLHKWEQFIAGLRTYEY